MKAKGNFFRYVLGKMISDGVVKFSDKADENFKKLFGSPTLAYGQSGYMDIEEYADHFVVIPGKKDFQEEFKDLNSLFKLYALVYYSIETQVDRNATKEAFPSGSFLEYKANIILPQNLNYSNVARSKLDKKEEDELFKFVIYQLDTKTTEEFLYEAMLHTKLNSIAEAKLDAKANLYQIALIVEHLAKGKELADKASPKAELAKEIIKDKKFSNSTGLNEILDCVQTYIKANVGEMGKVIAISPVLLFLPIPKSTKDCYTNFKANFANFIKADKSTQIDRHLLEFKELIAKIVVHEFSAEDICDVLKAYDGVPVVKTIITNICTEFIKLDLNVPEEFERAKFIGAALIKHGKLYENFLCENKLNQECIDRIVLYIEKDILIANDFSHMEMITIASKVKDTVKDFDKFFEKNPKLFDMLVKHFKDLGFMRTVSKDYDNLIKAIVKKKPEVLTSDYSPKYDISIKEYSKYIIKNTAYLKTLDAKYMPEDLTVLFSGEHTSDDVMNLSFDGFKHLAESIFDFKKFIENPKCLDEFRKDSRLDAFQKALSQNFATCKNRQRDHSFVAKLYMMCKDTKLQAEIENEMALMHVDNLKEALKWHPKLIQKVDVSKVCNMIQSFKEADKAWLESILQHEAKYILNEPKLKKEIIAYISKDENVFHVFRNLSLDMQLSFEEGLHRLIIQLDCDLSRYDILGELKDKIFERVDSEKLLELKAINHINYWAKKDRNYIDNKKKPEILFEFLRKDLPFDMSSDDINAVALYIKTYLNSYKALEKVKAFAMKHNQAFVDVGIDVNQLNSLGWADYDNVEKIKKAKEDKAADESRKSKAAEEKVRLEKIAREKEELEFRKAWNSSGETISKLSKLEEQVKKLGDELTKQKESQKQTKELKNLTVDEVYTEYKNCSTGKYEDYQCLTVDQKIGLVLKIYVDINDQQAIKMQIGHDIYQKAILAAPSNSEVLFKLLSSKPELYDYAIKNFKLSHDGLIKNNKFPTDKYIINNCLKDAEAYLSYFGVPSLGSTLVWDALLVIAAAGVYIAGPHLGLKVKWEHACGTAILACLFNQALYLSESNTYCKLYISSQLRENEGRY